LGSVFGFPSLLLQFVITIGIHEFWGNLKVILGPEVVLEVL
jgi:hypothetical protein